MGNEVLDIAMKYGSNVTVAGVLLYVVRSLYTFLKFERESYNKLVSDVIDFSKQNAEQSRVLIEKLELRAQTLLDAERQRFESTNKYERSFFLEIVEEKDAQLNDKNARIDKLIEGFLEMNKGRKIKEPI